MSINLAISQLPLVGEISTAMQNQPEAQQAAAQVQAVEAQKHDREQVSKTEAQDSSSPVSVQTRQGGAGGQDAQSKRQKKSNPEEAHDEPHASPWAGNIIDVKI